jgi:hypothetical protein
MAARVGRSSPDTGSLTSDVRISGRRGGVYVVVEERIPETVHSGAVDVATIGFIVGLS